MQGEAGWKEKGKVLPVSLLGSLCMLLSGTSGLIAIAHVFSYVPSMGLPVMPHQSQPCLRQEAHPKVHFPSLCLLGLHKKQPQTQPMLMPHCQHWDPATWCSFLQIRPHVGLPVVALRVLIYPQTQLSFLLFRICLPEALLPQSRRLPEFFNLSTVDI